MGFDKLAKKRKSVRSFKKKNVNFKHVLEAIDIALQGPFAGNHDHLNFVIIEKDETIKGVAKLCEQSWIADAPAIVVVCSDDTHLENIYGERGRIYSRQQAGAAVMSFLLSITEQGLGACWVGSYGDELLRERLRIPQHIQVEAVIPVGYEKKMPGEKKADKKELENRIFWEKWDSDRRPNLFGEHPTDYRAEGMS